MPGEHSPAHPLRSHVNPLSRILLVVGITAAGTAGEAAFGRVPELKTWLTVGVMALDAAIENFGELGVSVRTCHRTMIS